jgi:hypothetical protein
MGRPTQEDIDAMGLDGYIVDEGKAVSELVEGTKFDENKLRFDLIPVRPLAKIAWVFTMGAKKYADRNWEKGIKFCRLFAAMMRHAWLWFAGETYDVDGQHHLSSVAWTAMVLMELEETKPGFDDRPRKIEHPFEELSDGD